MSPRAAEIRSRWRRLAWLLVLVPPALIVLIAAVYASDVPLWDEWAVAPLLFKLRDGSLQFSDFMARHVDHRFVFPRIIIVGLMTFLGRWSIRAEVFASIAVAALQLALVWRMARASLRPKRVLPLTLAASMLIFHAAGSYNWLMGLQVAWHLALTCAVASFWALTARPGRWSGVITAAVFALVGSYSMSAGLLLWPVGLAGLIILRARATPETELRSIGQAAFWCGAAVAAIGFYFTDYAYASDSGILTGNLLNPARMGSFALAFLGRPFTTIPDADLAGVIGLFGVMAVVALGFRLIRGRKINGLLPPAVLPWMLMLAFTMTTTALVGAGRSHVAYAAQTSHYVALTGLFWIGLAGGHLAVPVAAGLVPGASSRRREWLERAALAVAVLLLIVAYAGSWAGGWADIRTVSGWLGEFESRMLSGAPNVPKDLVVDKIYPFYALPMEYSEEMLRRSEGFYGSSRMGRADGNGARPSKIENGPAAGVKPSYQGFADYVTCDTVSGWAWDRNTAGPIVVGVWLDGTRIGSQTADRQRNDLIPVGIGMGAHGFYGPLTGIPRDGREHTLTLTFADTREPLGVGERTIRCAAQ